MSRIRDLESTLSGVFQDLASLQGKYNTLFEEAKELRKKLAEAESNFKWMERHYYTLKADVDLQRRRAHVIGFDKGIERSEKKRQELKDTLARYVDENEKLRQELESVKSLQTTTSGWYERLRKENEALKDARPQPIEEYAEKFIIRHQEKLTQLEKRIAKLESTNETVQNK